MRLMLTIRQECRASTAAPAEDTFLSFRLPAHAGRYREGDMSEKPVRNILVVVKARVAAAAALGKTICEWLRKRGSHVQMLFAGLELAPYLTPPVDLIVVLGGDGTILGVARKVVGLEIPLVCINFGRVGFLSDIEPEDWEKGLEEVLDTDYCRRTTALAWQLTRYGHVVGKGFAVNDVVLSRAAMARLVCADIFVNNELMGSVRADGFLLSTPIGSSGYSVGAGGPLLSPEIRGVAFVPICPFLNTIPPMVFPCATIFRFELKPGTTESYLTVDGQEGQLMQTHDILEVQSIADAVLFKGRGISFLERLRTRSFILADPVRHRENTQS